MALAVITTNEISQRARQLTKLRAIFAMLLLLSTIFTVSVSAPTVAFADSVKKSATITPIQSADLQNARQMRIKADGSVSYDAPTLSAEANAYCIARLDNGAAWAIDEWIIGNELYKSYQDPVQACGGGYPYTITEIHMFLQVASAATIQIATDIESIDNDFFPGCPVPGEIIRLGPLVQLSFPAAGLYDIALELDTTVVVNEPFFVGFFFASTIDPNWHLSLITDNIQVACRSFNIWDTTIGYVDLGDDISVHENVYPESDPCFSAPENDPTCFDFDGVLLLHTGGIISEKTGCCEVAGDANNDGKLSIGDVTFLIDMLFTEGETPACNDAANANGDATVNIGDVTRMIETMFTQGDLPICGTSGK